MSKIFDALKKSQDQASGPILSSLADEPVSPWGHPAEEPEAAATAVAEPEFLLDEVDDTGIRTLPIRVTGSVPILPFDGTHPAASEQYRLARTRIIQHPKQPRILQVSSPGPGDGKTITAINLAGALSLKTGGSVLLVDGDFRRSVVHAHLGLPAGPGFAEVLAGTCSLEAALIHVEQFPNLYVLPAGTSKSSPAELLDSTRLKSTCSALLKIFKYVVVDSPPVSAVADSDLIQAACDGVVLVFRPDHSNRQTCYTALQAVPEEKLVGVILNCVADWFVTRKGYYSSYYYASPGGK